MGQVTTRRGFGSQVMGGLTACFLLLPLPALAYTISTWTFVNNGVSLVDNSADHKTLNFGGSSGGSNFSAKGNSTATATAGETLNAHLDLTGLTMLRGSLTVSIT